MNSVMSMSVILRRVLITTLISASAVVGQISEPCPRQTGLGTGSSGSSDRGLPSANSAAESNRTESDPKNRPLRIWSKPIARRTDSTDCAQGTVLLRIEFLSTGQIGKISLIKGLTKGLNVGAIEAAKKIRFDPETRNGKSITVTKTIAYEFSIY